MLDAAWYVYLIRAANNSLYCGISNKPIQRFHQHCKGHGAKFFRSSPAVALVYLERCTTKQEALRREYQLKRCSKVSKEQLIAQYAGDFQLPFMG